MKQIHIIAGFNKFVNFICQTHYRFESFKTRQEYDSASAFHSLSIIKGIGVLCTIIWQSLFSPTLRLNVVFTIKFV